MNKFVEFINDVTEKGQGKGLYVLGWWSDCLNCRTEPDADFNQIARFLRDFGFESFFASMSPNGSCIIQAGLPKWFNPHTEQDSEKEAAI